MKNKKRKIKKKYNPFKMWGSWVGLVILILALVSIQGTPILGGGLNSPFFVFLLLGTIGFLIGWGIHSIIRKVRK